MRREEAVRVMRDLVRKYIGQELLKVHPGNHRPYIQFRILGWNTNLDFVHGSLSIHALAEPYGRAGVNGRRPRLSRSEISGRFRISRDALLHREWDNGSHRLSVGLDYSLTHPENLRVLMEWCLQKVGKKSAGSRRLHKKLCVGLMEEILGVTAERDAVPSWLSLEPDGRQALPGYWEPLRLAVAYCWLEHYESRVQQEHDEKKRLACEKAGVDFLEIPYWVDLTHEDLLLYINDKYRHVADRIPSLWFPDQVVNQ